MQILKNNLGKLLRVNILKDLIYNRNKTFVRLDKWRIKNLFIYFFLCHGTKFALSTP